MSPPVIGLFGECSNETMFSWVWVLALELMQQGTRVVVVDADPSRAPFSGVIGTPIPAGISFLGLLHTPDATPMLLDCRHTLGNPTVLARGGTVLLLPALAAGETADPERIVRPPLQGSRRYESLRSSLCIAAAQADLILLVAPVGRCALGTALLAHACHAALLLADNSARQVLYLAQTARDADALRGGLIPSTCVETRDDGEAVPEGAWQSLWRTHPGLLPPHRKGDEGPERLLILKDKADDPERLTRAVQDLARACAPAALPFPSETAFHSLYQEDREAALSMFDRSIAPRLGTRASALAALRAVWDQDVRRWDDVQHLAKFVVQKFRWEEPSADAETLRPIYAALEEAAARGEIVEGHARVLLDHAALLAHAASWRLQGVQDADAIIAECEALVLRALNLPRSPNDQKRCALVLALHSRLISSTKHYELALNELRGFGQIAAKVDLLRALVDVVVHFSHSDPGLWSKVLALCHELEPLDARYSLHSAAIAEAHLGRAQDALLRLLRLGNLDRDAYLMAFADPDLEPLWTASKKRATAPANPSTK